MVSGVFRYPDDFLKPSLRPRGEAFIGGDENWMLRELLEWYSNRAQETPWPDGSPFFPVLLFGGPGLGKTFLLHLIASCADSPHGSRTPPAQTRFITAADWIRESSRLNDIRQKTTSPQTPLRFFFDDVHLLVGHPLAQHRLASYLDEVAAVGGTAVITTAQPLLQGSRLQDRLQSRLCGGLTLELTNPGTEARCSIIQEWAVRMGWTLDPDALQLAARHLPANPRQLRGRLSQLLPVRPRSGASLDRTELQQRLAANQDSTSVVPREVIDCVARRFMVTSRQMRGSSRRRTVMNARSIAMYIIRHMTSMPLKEIGALFSGRDHTTVLHAIRKVDALITEDDQLGSCINEMKELLNPNQAHGA